MRAKIFFPAVLTAAFFCACALVPVKNAPSPEPARKEAARKEATRNLSPEEAKKVESLYYKAVGAYSTNELTAALKFLAEIFAIQPAHLPAAELRKKIKQVSGNK